MPKIKFTKFKDYETKLRGDKEQTLNESQNKEQNGEI